jgi:tRNA C32,U32 (ribose-2'-O)-methylase TrmJ
MNDTFRDLKARLRKLDELLSTRGAGNVELAQAVSRVQRLVRRSDRSREPTAELRGLLERAESAGRNIG